MKSLIGFIALIIAVIGSGIVSYNWIEPHSFGGVLVFLVVWGIMSAVIRTVLAYLLILLFEE